MVHVGVPRGVALAGALFSGRSRATRGWKNALASRLRSRTPSSRRAASEVTLRRAKRRGSRRGARSVCVGESMSRSFLFEFKLLLYYGTSRRFAPPFVTFSSRASRSLPETSPRTGPRRPLPRSSAARCFLSLLRRSFCNAKRPANPNTRNTPATNATFAQRGITRPSSTSTSTCENKGLLHARTLFAASASAASRRAAAAAGEVSSFGNLGFVNALEDVDTARVQFRDAAAPSS